MKVYIKFSTSFRGPRPCGAEIKTRRGRFDQHGQKWFQQKCTFVFLLPYNSPPILYLSKLEELPIIHTYIIRNKVCVSSLLWLIVVQGGMITTTYINNRNKGVIDLHVRLLGFAAACSAGPFLLTFRIWQKS